MTDLFISCTTQERGSVLRRDLPHAVHVLGAEGNANPGRKYTPQLNCAFSTSDYD